ncbi:MAG: iron ABC transporter permease [Treponema sp.]|jgi:iron complex transport system permease protein|nr:iron ABC transporter permease [Treponema sp.]
MKALSFGTSGSALNKLLLAGILSLVALCAGASLGSSGIMVSQTIRVIGTKILNLKSETDPQITAIVWELRLPRTILAFIVGGSLAVSGAVFQSVLKNPLASPYILGVSSGASLGAALVMMGAISLPLGFLRPFILPFFGFIFGLGTVLIVFTLAARLDKTISNNTIILLGMVISLFVNAILATLHSLFREELKNLLIWQLGSFAMRSWIHVGLIIPFLVLGIGGVFLYTKEMDILSFGEDEGRAMGVNAPKVRKRLFLCAALLTGAAVSLCGAIGFVDLIAPHVARRITGPRHSYVIYMSFCAGGILMLSADILARIAVSPSELPIGAVTALIGAPFFAWLYFGRRKN